MPRAVGIKMCEERKVRTMPKDMVTITIRHDVLETVKSFAKVAKMSQSEVFELILMRGMKDLKEDLVHCFGKSEVKEVE